MQICIICSLVMQFFFFQLCVFCHWSAEYLWREPTDADYNTVNPRVLTIDGNLGRAPGRSHVAGVRVCVFLLQLSDGQSHDLLLLGHLVSASIPELGVPFEPCDAGWSLCSLTQQGDRRRLVCLAVFQQFNEFMDWFCKNQRGRTTYMHSLVTNIRIQCKRFTTC